MYIPKSNGLVRKKNFHFHHFLNSYKEQVGMRLEFYRQTSNLHFFSSVSSVATPFLNWREYWDIFRGASKISGNILLFFTGPEIVSTHFSPCSSTLITIQRDLTAVF